MFESLKHWFESLEQDSKLFEHRDDELLHGALASVLFHIISADKRADSAEKHEFGRILESEFDLDSKQVEHLYQAAKASTSDILGDLHTINIYLKQNPNVRLRFMQMLLHLIDVHGATKAELDLFYEALHEIFPEVNEPGGSGL